MDVTLKHCSLLVWQHFYSVTFSTAQHFPVNLKRRTHKICGDVTSILEEELRLYPLLKFDVNNL